MPMQPKMANRVSALETQMGEMQTTQEQMQATLQTMAQQIQQQSHVLTELSKQLGRKHTIPEREDPMAWITRAEIYFDVQGTVDEMRVKLARLSMEGATIHWFNLLMETEDDLS
ncbi:retrotransposon gag protein [Trifolium medium]|uniref:Retrotransposon gag protein n=1 Tax=Trifolium medium TaxID=97028 RepID=A0A392N4T5_9FABA|nr:retrotransposon gag protein [Trifolium medium]